MKLSPSLLVLALAAAMPLSACAQTAQAQSQDGPPPAVRAQMQQARDNAKTAAFNALSADHRARVQSVVDGISNGTQTDLRAAATQIDGILTPDEQKAVLAERDKMMQTMRANMPQGGPNGAGPGPGGQGRGPDGQGNPNGTRRANDPGRFLLQLSVSREKMRELRQKQQQSQ
ncbi:MAG: hypothetical protein QOI11_3453 [Candidatus Eremiobacteraeota bacterium]|nr:hypothetical protein [Candidatus Eremiobacteraeota bacterium]